MFTYILWRFLILETFVLGALCCPCLDEHPQKLFCKSELVLKVKIHEEDNTAKYQLFTMEIKKVFKGDVRGLILMKNRYVLLVIYRICRDPFMGRRGTYVIFGYNIYGKVLLSPTICQGTKLWWRASRFVQHAVKADYYKDNCDCFPEISYDDNYDINQKYCEWKSSYMKRSDGKCNWVNTTSFQRCQVYKF